MYVYTYFTYLPNVYVVYVHTVSWEPEGRYCSSKMFRWEPEGRYRCAKSMAISPFWFSTEHLWSAMAPFWLSTDDTYIHTSTYTYLNMFKYEKQILPDIFLNSFQYNSQIHNYNTRSATKFHLWKVKSWIRSQIIISHRTTNMEFNTNWNY